MVKDKEEILKLIRENTSLEPVIKKYNKISSKTLTSKYLPRLGISVHKEIKIAKIRKAFENGVSSMKELCECVDLSSKTIVRYCKKNNIKLPFKVEYFVKNRSPELDELIAQGVPCTEIGRINKMTNQSAHQYIIGSGQQEFWKERRAIAKEEARNKRLEKPRLREQFYLCFQGRMFQLAEKKGFAVEKAINYCFSIKKRKSRLEQRLNKIDDYIKIFSRYEQAKKNNEKPSLEELGKGTGFWPNDVRRLLLGTETESSI